MIEIKNFKFDAKYVKVSAYALGVIILSISFKSILDNFNFIGSFFKKLINILSPFFIGFFIAYLLNPLIRFFEKNILIKIKFFNKYTKLKRGVSLITSYTLAITLIVWFISYLAPEIVDNIMNLFKVLATNINSIITDIEKFLNENPNIFSDIFSGNTEEYKYITSQLNNILNTLLNTLYQLPSMLTTTLSSFILGTMSFASKLLNLVLGIIISIYILADKEKFGRQCKKIIYGLLSQSTSDKIMNIISDANKIFENFLIGKIIDSTIIGIICFVGLYLLKIPYTLLISLIIGVTNMIPYFGPFIGGIPAVLITIIVDSPISGLWVLLFILALQQFDGNILGPKILGDSTGLSPFWIIFSITIGGALANVFGMFIGVPIFAVIYNMFSQFINKKYNKKFEIHSNIKGDMK